MNTEHIKGAQFRTAADFVDDQGKHNANVLLTPQVRNADKMIRYTCVGLIVLWAASLFVDFAPRWLVVDANYAVYITAGVFTALGIRRFVRRSK